MLKGFHESEEGAIVVLSLLLLPVFLGFGLILIDAGRGNSAHGDLQAAADAIALAGARELDGGSDALERARAAMSEIDNSVSLLAIRDDDATEGNDLRVDVSYDESDTPFLVRFLDAIPADDTTPITAGWLTDHATLDPAEAQYVYVSARSGDLQTIFGSLLPLLSRGDTAAVGTVPVGATAVAKSESAACDIPPLFICNPFEYDASGAYVGDGLQQAFLRGDLHGRLIRLHPSGNETPMPGNFGFLDVSDADVSLDAEPQGGGARSINDFFAGRRNQSCYSSGLVRTKPGASNGVRTGINARFDMYGGRYQSGSVSGQDGFNVRTALNVRKGITPGTQGNAIDNCVIQGNSLANGAVIGDDHIWTPGAGFNANGVPDTAYGLPDNLTMNAPNTGGLVTSDDVAGAYIGVGDWDGQTYLDRNYGAGIISYADVPSSFPGVAEGYSGPGSVSASRYDVYQYELTTDMDVNGVPTPLYQVRAPGAADAENPSPTGEIGEALCLPGGNGNSSDGAEVVTDPDPRVLVAAIIDCGENADETGRSEFPVNSYASIFMARPMVSYAPSMDMTIDVEVIDITGYGGNGTLETFIREESILVR